MAQSRRAKKVAQVRAQEMARLADLSVERLENVVVSLNARLVTAAHDAVQQQLVRDHLRDVASFTQEILAVVSHDLRNPLNAILLSAHLILVTHPTDEPLHKPVNRIVGSAMAATRLINDLLDYSQARLTGSIPVVRREANIHDIAHAAVDELEFARQGHSVRVRAEGDGLGNFDPDRLSQVLMNLIANALAHSPDGSDVDVTTTGTDGSVVVSVRNANREGPIPPELMPVLFEPFKRGTARAGPRDRSVGLGLYIVAQIVKAHGGRVDVRSSTDEGTTFTVILQRAETA